MKKGYKEWRRGRPIKSEFFQTLIVQIRLYNVPFSLPASSQSETHKIHHDLWKRREKASTLLMETIRKQATRLREQVAKQQQVSFLTFLITPTLIILIIIFSLLSSIEFDLISSFSSIFELIFVDTWAQCQNLSTILILFVVKFANRVCLCFF